MFGYVKIYKPELKHREYEQYKGVYCALCRSLGKRYGLIARMTLSYDFTFLALFRMALSEKEVSFSPGRCPFRPTKHIAFCVGEGTEAIDYAADVAVLLTYHKLCDTISDEMCLKRLGARILRLFVKRDYKKAVVRRPDEAQWATEYMRAQQAAETDDTCSVDRAAHPTAEFLSRLAVCGCTEDVLSEEVSRFGYCLGRYIYLADAADDLEEDKKSGSFNPYWIYAKHTSDIGCDLSALRAYAAQTLHSSVAVCAECYEALTVHRFDSILYNVIYWGMPYTIEKIEKTQQEEQHNEKSL